MSPDLHSISLMLTQGLRAKWPVAGYSYHFNKHGGATLEAACELGENPRMAGFFPGLPAKVDLFLFGPSSISVAWEAHCRAKGVAASTPVSHVSRLSKIHQLATVLSQWTARTGNCPLKHSSLHVCHSSFRCGLALN